MNVIHDRQYTLRLVREVPLEPGDSGRGASAFDHIAVELLRDDGHVSGSASVYFPREREPAPNFVAAAVAQGNGFLARVCDRALDHMGFLREHISARVEGGGSQAFFIDEFRVLDAGPSEHDLSAMFARALMRTLPRCIDAVFIRPGIADLSFWSATIGAMLIDGFIVASAASRLPGDRPAKRRKPRVPKTAARLVN